MGNGINLIWVCGACFSMLRISWAALTPSRIRFFAWRLYLAWVTSRPCHLYRSICKDLSLRLSECRLSGLSLILDNRTSCRYNNSPIFGFHTHLVLAYSPSGVLELDKHKKYCLLISDHTKFQITWTRGCKTTTATKLSSGGFSLTLLSPTLIPLLKSYCSV